jgi:LPXTG-motif cell wall-anchored protein
MVNDFFNALYEFFGLMPLYSSDMAYALSGTDPCTNDNGTQWLTIIGLIMIGIVFLTYFIFYHLINSAGFNKVKHWWLVAFIMVMFNFIIGFTISFNIYTYAESCGKLGTIVFADSVSFGFVNALWSILIYIFLTTLPWPRRMSSNCSETTFWRP